jgi:hypothetical protein
MNPLVDALGMTIFGLALVIIGGLAFWPRKHS